jgi:hypothetical protein
MNSDNYCRRRFAVLFCVLSIFLVTVTFATASTARENAAGSRDQGDNAY